MDDPEPEYMASTRTVYDHSAAFYADQVGTTVTSRFERPLDRAVLDAFAEEVRELGDLRVIDVGCGTGRVTSHLAERGLDVDGVDISASMIAAARAAHPHLEFNVGSLDGLPLADASRIGAVLWYSIIHTPLTGLEEAWSEIARVLVPGGLLLVAFQAGRNEVVPKPDAYGSGATLTRYQHDIDDVAGSLERSGFAVRARVEREPELAHESTPQGFLVCRGA